MPDEDEPEPEAEPSTDTVPTEVVEDHLASRHYTATPSVCRDHGIEPGELYEYQRTERFRSLVSQVRSYLSLMQLVVEAVGVVLAIWFFDDLVQELAWMVEDALHRLRGVA
jgi:hypothetical protein